MATFIILPTIFSELYIVARFFSGLLLIKLRLILRSASRLDAPPMTQLGKTIEAKYPATSYSEAENPKSAECAVCLSEFARGESVRRLDCKHLFHRDCVDKWLTAAAAAGRGVTSCPLCRDRLALLPPKEEPPVDDCGDEWGHRQLLALLAQFRGEEEEGGGGDSDKEQPSYSTAVHFPTLLTTCFLLQQLLVSLVNLFSVPYLTCTCTIYIVEILNNTTQALVHLYGIRAHSLTSLSFFLSFFPLLIATMSIDSSPQSSTTPSGVSGSSLSPSLTLALPANPQLSIKLTPTNYLLWHAQITPLLRCYHLMGHVDGTLPAPPQLLNDQPNPAYLHWYDRDQLVLIWITHSLSEAVMSNIINKTTAFDAWSALARIYASGSKIQIRHLTKELQHLRRGDMGIHEYLQTAKSKADQLAALGAPVRPDDLVGWITDGLGEDYRPFVRHLESKMEPISFEDLHSLLLSEESQLKRYHSVTFQPAPVAFFSHPGGFAGSRGRGGRGNGRGAGRGRGSSNPNYSSSPVLFDRPAVGLLGARPKVSHQHLVCHNCGGRGHIRPHCPSPSIPSGPSQPPALPAHSAPLSQPGLSHIPPVPHAYLASSPAQPFNPRQWLIDSGTSHHLTSDLDNLAHHSEYNGTDRVLFGNGNSLPISHSGSSRATLSDASLSLDNILHVKNAPYNLLSINSLTRSNPVSIEFFDSSFVIKDRRTNAKLYRGFAVDGLYSLPLHVSRSLSPQACLASLDTWHQRLGHANLPAVKSALRHHQINFVSSPSSLCHGCAVSKIHKLPFPTSTFKANAPLELVCSDVWGPAPVLSYDDQSYYILFYDHYSKFSWIYFVRYKSQLLSVFIQFRQMVEKFFSLPIKVFQSDWGGEYQALTSYLLKHGISHRSSCPYTPEQNGCAERKHRH
ncbi:unnamed protein product [Linum tenue]|uniref:Uncharacterized protein n=1 Tax=Linum tenue TaxID=586396 RepID=A0AAV0L756_9ROSI|nr:unnamed protein product [Linum tenue]